MVLLMRLRADLPRLYSRDFYFPRGAVREAGNELERALESRDLMQQRREFRRLLLAERFTVELS